MRAIDDTGKDFLQFLQNQPPPMDPNAPNGGGGNSGYQPTPGADPTIVQPINKSEPNPVTQPGQGPSPEATLGIPQVPPPPTVGTPTTGPGNSTKPRDLFPGGGSPGPTPGNPDNPHPTPAKPMEPTPIAGQTPTPFTPLPAPQPEQMVQNNLGIGGAPTLGGGLLGSAGGLLGGGLGSTGGEQIPGGDSILPLLLKLLSQQNG